MSETRISGLLGKITVLVVICFLTLPAQAKYGGGTGEPNDPYLIFDANQMNAIGADSNDWDKHFLLCADIDLAAFDGQDGRPVFNMIAPDQDSSTWRFDGVSFTGVFDGNGHTISNFTYTSTDRNYIGIFGYVDDPNAEIRNLGLINPYVDAGTRWYVGSLVGRNFGKITNCYVLGGSVAGKYGVGGLVGDNIVGTIGNCYSEGIVSGSEDVGGLVGYNNSGTISNCYATGSVSGNYRVGGLVGWNLYNAITKCYATVSVFGNYLVGGLVGYNCNSIVDCYTSGNVTGGNNSSYVGGLCGKSTGPSLGTGQSRIQNCFSKATVTGNTLIGGLIGHSGAIVTGCYSTGSVTGKGDYSRSIGGLIGRNGGHGGINNCYSTGSVAGDGGGGLVGYNKGTVLASFWDIETSGQSISAGGTGLPTAEMQMQVTFTDAGWGCEPVWTIDTANDYPRLWWENKPGEAIPTPSYGGGSGEPNDPYLIYTTEQLNTIGLIPCHLDKQFKLMADVNLSGFTGTSFNIIGKYVGWHSPDNKPFTGVFDGNGHTISNFSYACMDGDHIGLFGWLDDPNAEIKNLGLIDPNLDAGTGEYVGSLVGYLENGTISNCYVQGGSVSGNSGVGGLVGQNGFCDFFGCGPGPGTITNSYSTASVSGDEDVGGLVGGNSGTITNCCSTGSVTGHYDGIGGLVGVNSWGSTISNCYSTGSVAGYGYVGGLVGVNSWGSTISNCYATGSVTGTTDVGGLVGKNYYSTISNCYATGTVSGSHSVGGLVGKNDGTITNCYSSASVTGTMSVGGLVGWNSKATISNCYATGSVSGTGWSVGGLVGFNMVMISTSFWDIQTSGQTTSVGGTGKTTAEMQMMSTFTDAGWDFVGETVNGIEDIWFIPQQDYPHLWWEGMQVPMKLTPRTLNCRSKGNWVKAHLTLPEGFTVADIDPDRPAVLHSFGFESAPLYVSVNENELVQIEAAFEREALCSLAGDWPKVLTVAGFLTDGNIFLGTSKVRMITPGLKEIGELSLYWLNADCVHPDFCNDIDMNRDSLVNLLDYALLQNNQVEFVSE